MEFVQKKLLLMMGHPLIIVVASLASFFVLLWLVLPFAIYGTRQRLDRIIALLEEIKLALAGAATHPPATEDTGAEGDLTEKQRAASKLFQQVRKEMRSRISGIREHIYDPRNVAFQFKGPERKEYPLFYLSLRDGWVLITFPVEDMAEAFDQFSAAEFRAYVASFLPEKYGYFSALSPDGRELQINLEPKERNELGLFVGIVQEKLVDLTQEEPNG